MKKLSSQLPNSPILLVIQRTKVNCKLAWQRLRSPRMVTFQNKLRHQYRNTEHLNAVLKPRHVYAYQMATMNSQEFQSAIWQLNSFPEPSFRLLTLCHGPISWAIIARDCPKWKLSSPLPILSLNAETIASLSHPGIPCSKSPCQAKHVSWYTPNATWAVVEQTRTSK